MQEPIYLSREQSRRVDQIAIEQLGVSGAVLMENAGRGVVDVLFALDPELFRETSAPPLGGPGGAGGSRFSAAPRVAILCGKGNNAGDGFVIARHLAVRGVNAAAILLSPPSELTGDARLNFGVLERCGLPTIDLSAKSGDLQALAAALDGHAGGVRWLVDALLGTGAHDEPREPYATAIQWMNVQGARRLAVDLPSGLDCDTGTPAAATVRADATCTFVSLKTGFANSASIRCLGEIHVLDVGIPRRLVLVSRE